MTNVLDKSRQWLTNLSMRTNLLNMQIPYIPLLLKDITAYVQSSDYENNLAKTIQTIGYIQYEEDIMKIVDINLKDVKFPIKLDHLSINSIIFDVPRNNCNNIWDFNVVRVYGTLAKKEAEITIEVTHIFEVKDVFLCEKMFDTLSLLARKEYRQYSNETEVNKLLDMQWKVKQLSRR